MYVAEQRWRRRGYPKDGIYDISFWVVIWGVIGARLYHVITDYQLFEDDPLRAFQIWRGGLSIWGAVIGGAIAVIVITRRRQLPDAGRHGLHGARASCSRRRSAAGATTSTRSCSGSRRRCRGRSRSRRSTGPPGTRSSRRSSRRSSTSRSRASPSSASCCSSSDRAALKLGQTFALYVVLYTFARFWFENMRIDPAHEIAGLRINAWVSIVVCLLGVGVVRVARSPRARATPSRRARADVGNHPVAADGVS